MSVAARFRHQPGRVLAVASLVAATVTVGLVGPASGLALVTGGVGVLALAIGITREDRRIAALSPVAFLGSVLAAGAAGGPSERVLPATAAAILAWEFGIGSLAAAAELRSGTTERAELRHVGIATGVGALGTGTVYGLERAIAVGVSPVAIVLLLVAVVALALAIRD